MMKSNNKLLHEIAENFGEEIEQVHSDNYYLKRIAENTEHLDIEAFKITSDKGTASADTMGKLYIEVGETVDVYYTKATESGGTTTYSWVKLDDDILDNLSIDWSDIQNKPSTYAPSSHNHTESEITDLGDYIEKSNTAGLVKNDGSIDTNMYLTQHQSLDNYVTKSSTSGLIKNDGTIDTTQYLSSHQDISNYVQKSQTAGLIKNDGTIDSTQYLSSHQDISGKADKTDFDTLEVVITYTDDSTETKEIYVVPTSP